MSAEKPTPKKRGTWITEAQARTEAHNWKMMHPNHTAAQLRAALGEIHSRIRSTR